MDPLESTRRFVQLAWNEGRMDEARELLAEDFVNHTPVNPRETREEFLDRVARFRRAFPDLRMTIEDMLLDGDKVVTRWAANGTHHGSFRGIEATGRAVTFTGIAIDRVVDGLRVEGWAQLDMVGLLAQLGVTL